MAGTSRPRQEAPETDHPDEPQHPIKQARD